MSQPKRGTTRDLEERWDLYANVPQAMPHEIGGFMTVILVVYRDVEWLHLEEFKNSIETKCDLY